MILLSFLLLLVDDGFLLVMRPLPTDCTFGCRKLVDSMFSFSNIKNKFSSMVSLLSFSLSKNGVLTMQGLFFRQFENTGMPKVLQQISYFEKMIQSSITCG